MTPTNYLLHVTSQPKTISASLLQEFYVTEHLNNLVESGCSLRASFYTQIPHPFDPSPPPPRFLALYQTPYPELMKCEHFHKVLWHSDLFLQETNSTFVTDAADFEARNYELIQNYDPFGIGETPSPQLLTVEMHPKNHLDYDRWYREEHLDMLSKMPGYRRCLRYKFISNTELAWTGFHPAFMAVHEVEDVVGFAGEEVKLASGTEWSRKHGEESEVVILQGWKLVASKGF